MHPIPARLLPLMLLLGLSWHTVADAAIWQLAIQPILPRDRTVQAYTPLAEYLSRATGETIRIRASHNFVDYWESMRVTREDTLLFEPAELIGKRIATIPPPSLGGLRLARMFPNPLRQPVVVATRNAQESIDRLKAKQALAALAPTPLIRGDDSLNVITTTDPVPHMALSGGNLGLLTYRGTAILTSPHSMPTIPS